MAYGKLAYDCLGVCLELSVMRSASGYYIGTYDDGGAVSRESVEYFGSIKEAEEALKNGEWTQRSNP